MDHPVMAPADPSRLYWFSEQQWRQIEAVFPRPHGKKGFAQAVPNRQACEAVLFRARTGCPWRDLPAAYGPWHTIYMRWRRWADAGVPERAAQAILAARQRAGDFDPALALLDSTVVRAHQHAAGAQKKKSGVGQPALGRSRGGLSTKIHLVALDERTALALSLSAGQAHDAPPGEQLVAEVITPEAQIQAVCADRAYDTDALRAQLAAAPTPKQAVIPPRANRRVPYAYDKERYRQRNRVERLVGRLKQFRAVATRYDKLDGMFGGLVVLCLAGIALR
jgi:transposase